MTTYALYPKDTIDDVKEKVKEFTEKEDNTAKNWTKQRNGCMFISSKLDWDTVRSYMDEVAIVAIAHTEKGDV